MSQQGPASPGKLNFVKKALPKGYQIVSDTALAWLNDNYPKAFEGVAERVYNEGEAPIPPPPFAEEDRFVCNRCGKTLNEERLMDLNRKRLNKMYPLLGDSSDKKLVRNTPVADCEERCPIYDLCPYLKRGQCTVEIRYLNERFSLFTDPDKGIGDLMNELDMVRFENLMTLWHQLVKFEKVAFSLKHNIEIENKKGARDIHPVFGLIQKTIREIETNLSKMKLDKKWEEKFGVPGQAPDVPRGRTVAEMMKKGNPNYYKEISKEG